MKRLLWLPLLVALPVAASAQNVAGTSLSSPPGLKLEAAGWSPDAPSFYGGLDLAPPLAGSPRANTYGHANIRTTRAGNVTSYSGAPVSNSNLKNYGSGAIWRGAAVTATNTGAVDIKYVHLEFVFTDPATGAEVLRVRRRSSHRLKPGKSYVYAQTVYSSKDIRRADNAEMSVEVLKVVYADKTMWRKQ